MLAISYDACKAADSQVSYIENQMKGNSFHEKTASLAEYKKNAVFSRDLQSNQVNYFSDYLDIPTYIRRGISLNIT